MMATAKARFVGPAMLATVHCALSVVDYDKRGRWTYIVEDGQWSNHGIDQVDASQGARLVGGGEEGHKSTSDDGRNDTDNNPSPTVGGLPNAVSNQKSEEDTDGTRGGVHQRGLFRVVTEVADQSGRVGGNHATGYRQLK